MLDFVQNDENKDTWGAIDLSSPEKIREYERSNTTSGNKGRRVLDGNNEKDVNFQSVPISKRKLFQVQRTFSKTLEALRLQKATVIPKMSAAGQRQRKRPISKLKRAKPVQRDNRARQRPNGWTLEGCA